MNAFSMMSKIYATEGLGKLFSGVVPRMSWISIGGFVFFGSFEASKSIVTAFLFGRDK